MLECIPILFKIFQFCIRSANYNASNTMMRTTGTITILVRDKNEVNGEFTPITTIVSPDMKDEFLVSSEDQITLGILHEGYPNVNLRAKKQTVKKVDDNKVINEDIVEWYLRPVAEQEKKKADSLIGHLDQFATEVETFLREAQRQESMKIDEMIITTF